MTRQFLKYVAAGAMLTAATGAQACDMDGRYSPFMAMLHHSSVGQQSAATDNNDSSNDVSNANRNDDWASKRVTTPDSLETNDGSAEAGSDGNPSEKGTA